MTFELKFEEKKKRNTWRLQARAETVQSAQAKAKEIGVSSAAFAEMALTMILGSDPETIRLAREAANIGDDGRLIISGKNPK